MRNTRPVRVKGGHTLRLAAVLWPSGEPSRPSHRRRQFGLYFASLRASEASRGLRRGSSGRGLAAGMGVREIRAFGERKRKKVRRFGSELATFRSQNVATRRAPNCRPLNPVLGRSRTTRRHVRDLAHADPGKGSSEWKFAAIGEKMGGSEREATPNSHGRGRRAGVAEGDGGGGEGACEGASAAVVRGARGLGGEGRGRGGWGPPPRRTRGQQRGARQPLHP